MDEWIDTNRQTEPIQSEVPKSNNAESFIGTPELKQGDEILEMDEQFNFDGFQVVRREFFAHQHEPSITFNNCKFYVNSACLNKFPNVEYVQVLVNQDTQILALRPCAEGLRDAYAWCGHSKGKRKPKQTTCKIFYAKMFDLMGWNPDFRYRILGKMIHANGEYLLAFDLASTEIYQKTYSEGAKPKTSRIPVYPASWQNQFGLSVKEHRQSLQVNTFKGYAVYCIKDSSEIEKKRNNEQTQKQMINESILNSGGEING